MFDGDSFGDGGIGYGDVHVVRFEVADVGGRVAEIPGDFDGVSCLALVTINEGIRER